MLELGGEMNEDMKNILKTIGRGFALAGTCALILGMVYFGVKYGTNTQNEVDDKNSCQCECDACQDCEEKEAE